MAYSEREREGSVDERVSGQKQINFHFLGPNVKPTTINKKPCLHYCGPK